MKKTLIVAAFTCFAGQAFAQDYAEHDAVIRFTDLPCTSVFDILDADDPDILEVGLDGVVSWGAQYAMTWGFILGYDTARGGLHEGDKTTLARLREECEAAPEKTAFEILESF